MAHTGCLQIAIKPEKEKKTQPIGGASFAGLYCSEADHGWSSRYPGGSSHFFRSSSSKSLRTGQEEMEKLSQTPSTVLLKRERERGRIYSTEGEMFTLFILF